MSRLLDGLYLGAAIITFPIWVTSMAARGKLRTDWRGRFGWGDVMDAPAPGRTRILIHAVSVGEVNAAQRLIRELDRHAPPPEIVIASTTDTGFARARELYGETHAVIRYPFDLSGAVRRLLDRVQPDLLLLVELEVWPNLMRICEARRIPVGVVNGRLSERSYRRYHRIRGLIAPSFRRLAFVAAQSETYAARFRALGAAAERLHVVGTMKWDTAEILDQVEGADALASELGIDRSRPLVVAGSTAPGEHELLVRAVPSDVQLLCAPRKPEWFEAAARAMPGCARRSRNQRGSDTGRFLLDTIGELRKAYALADIVVVGRTFVPLGGSDMIEPVALGCATIVGPHVENFLDAAQTLLDCEGLLQVTPSALPTVLRALLRDSDRREQLARNGRLAVQANQGATQRHVKLISPFLRKSDAAQKLAVPA